MPEYKDILDKLKKACDNPRAQLDYYLSQGKKVIGCFPPYTPEELVYATGMIPMGLWGAQTTLEEVKSYLPAFACPIMQSTMELGLRGSYKGLSAVIIPALCDTLRCMTQNWRFGVTSIPMIPVVYPQNRSSKAAVDYLVSEYENILVMLATITGNMMTEKALSETIEIYNAHNEAVRRFDGVANSHLDIITPKVRHTVHKSSFFYDKKEHTELLNELSDELEKLPAFDFKGKRAVLSGITCEPDELLDILEEQNIAVVADDLAQENRQFRTDTPLKGGGALKRLALQWMNRTGCSMIHENKKVRGGFLSSMCKETNADCVIMCMMKFCDPEEYDQPSIEKTLRENGYQTLAIEIDSQNRSYEQLRTRIQSFAEML